MSVIKKALLGAVMALMILIPLASPLFEVKAASTIDEEDTVVPYLKAIVNITYESNTVSATSTSQSHIRSKVIGIILGPKNYVFENIPENFMTKPISQLIKYGKVLKMSTLVPLSDTESDIEPEEHNTNTGEEWSVEDTAPSTVVKYYDNNGNGYKVASIEISTSITISDGYYYIELYDMATNNTGADTNIYIGWENSTDTSLVVYGTALVGEVYRDTIPLWYAMINATERPSGTNAVIKSIKLENVNVEKVQIVKRDAPLEDHRDLNITFEVPELTVSSISFINDFANQIMRLPNNIKKTWKGTTDAWGWKSLHQTMLKIAENYKQTGEKYVDYNVKAAQLILKTGKNLAKNIKEEIEKYSTTTKPVVDVLDEVKDKTIRSVTLALNVAPENLEKAQASTIGTMTATGKKIYDVTHAAIASVKKAVGGSVEWVINSIKGLTETVNNEVQHFVDGVVGVFNNIKKWFSIYWIPLLIIGILILIIIGMFVVQRYAPKVDVI